MNLNNAKIAVIGLGYVGLPLAVEFANHFPLVGYDISEERVSQLIQLEDVTRELTGEEISANLQLCKNLTDPGLFLTSEKDDFKECNIYIVTVPTPVDENKNPDLSLLITACKMIGDVLKKDDIVIFESTTFPGCTEEVCVPQLEKSSGLQLNVDFAVGYSPERVSPGDRVRKLRNITKITSGSTPAAADFVDRLYKKIITAGTHKAPSIKVAEASKAIENAQRDLNISFVNELAIIFDKIGIDTCDVLDAASTKWNFLNFRPGLVGGHCIDVDPYYLVYKAQQLGYTPEVILSGRSVNDRMGTFVAGKVIDLMKNKRIEVNKSKTLILGFTFKENCPDIRNTKIIDIYRSLEEAGSEITIADSWADFMEVKRKYGIEIENNVSELSQQFDAIILAVAHDDFKNFDFSKYKKDNAVIYDCKGIAGRKIIDARL